MGVTVIDLSHPIHDGMPGYPGLPGPRVGLHLSHAESRSRYDDRAEFAIGRLELVGNTGTYLDSPFHRDPDGPDVSRLPLDRLVELPTLVLDAREAAAGGRDLDLALPDPERLVGTAVLVRTDWDRRWGREDYWEPGPFLGGELVARLVAARPAVVGVDFWNVDDTADPTRPAHTHLLRAGIVVVEHLCHLADLPAGATTSFVPLAVQGAPSLPIRAFAVARSPAVTSDG
ncbi:cyclase family protein [Egicoccus sp. AB-alg2]|uniref:cyclase family protein n=1 Tax=Egicoccus sp. AB-alg2 TaxID=3242693 RepID=UPI00359D8347